MTYKDRVVNGLLKENHKFVGQRVIDGREVFQLVSSSYLRLRVLRGHHYDIEHLGKDKTIDLISQRFYWPGMTDDIEGYIRYCHRRIMRKAADPPLNPWSSLLSTFSA